jgi:cell cycle sensor histidine kinase DivJ
MPEIVADKRAVKQMLLNLLSNAIKFSGSGGRVTVSASQTGARFDIVVEDTGVGIAPDDLHQIGNPFFQVRGNYDRPYEGTGLGLSIVKGLAGLHGGRLLIESKLGVGTRMTIRLPMDCEKGVPVTSGEVVSLNSDVKAEASAGAPEPHDDYQAQARKRA